MKNFVEQFVFLNGSELEAPGINVIYYLTDAKKNHLIIRCKL